MSTETQPASQSTTDGRGYTVLREVRAGDLDPDVMVWQELPPVQASDPMVANDAAAARDDRAGVWKEGTRYGATTRLKTKTPTKKVDVKWS